VPTRRRGGTPGNLDERFLSWIAGRYDELQQRLKMRSREIRGQGRGRAVHARLPSTLAELQSGFELWLEFALEIGAICTAERLEMEQRCERAFEELATLQTRYHQAGDPALRFVSLLKAALAARPRACGGPSGHCARIAGGLGLAPQSDGPGLDSSGSPHRLGKRKRSFLGASDQFSRCSECRRHRAPEREPTSASSQVAGKRPSCKCRYRSPDGAGAPDDGG